MEKMSNVDDMGFKLHKLREHDKKHRHPRSASRNFVARFQKGLREEFPSETDFIFETVEETK